MTLLCLAGRGPTLSLDDLRERYTMSAVALGGRWLVQPEWEVSPATEAAPAFYQGLIYVSKLTRFGINDDFYVRADRFNVDAVVGAAVAKRNGSFAWITCPGHGAAERPWRPGCRARDSYNRLYTFSRPAGFDHAFGPVVDQGPGLDPRTLKLSGSRLTWRKNGGLRSAILK